MEDLESPHGAVFHEYQNGYPYGGFRWAPCDSSGLGVESSSQDDPESASHLEGPFELVLLAIDRFGIGSSTGQLKHCSLIGNAGKSLVSYRYAVIKRMPPPVLTTQVSFKPSIIKTQSIIIGHYQNCPGGSPGLL
jgi:hypothetical protein